MRNIRVVAHVRNANLSRPRLEPVDRAAPGQSPVGGRRRRRVWTSTAAVGLLLGRMLDEGDQPARHEPARPDGRAAAGHLADLDDAAGGRDLEPAAVLRGRDLERLDALARIDHDFDPIASHTRTIPRLSMRHD